MRLAIESIHTSRTEAADTLGTCIAVSQNAGSCTVCTVYLHWFREIWTGIRIREAGGRHVEVEARLGGVDGGFDRWERLCDFVWRWRCEGVLQWGCFVGVEMVNGGWEWWERGPLDGSRRLWYLFSVSISFRTGKPYKSNPQESNRGPNLLHWQTSQLRLSLPILTHCWRRDWMVRQKRLFDPQCSLVLFDPWTLSFRALACVRSV